MISQNFHIADQIMLAFYAWKNIIFPFFNFSTYRVVELMKRMNKLFFKNTSIQNP